MLRARLALSLVAVFLAPGPPPVLAASRDPFQPSGELSFHATGGTGSSASFDDRRVVGPGLNVARRDDGIWLGEFGPGSVAVRFEGDAVSGPGVFLHVSRRGDTLEIRGDLDGTRMSLEIGPKKLRGRKGACSVDLDRTSPGLFEGQVGCVDGRAGIGPVSGARLAVAGAAAEPDPPLPQFALALAFVLPG